MKKLTKRNAHYSVKEGKTADICYDYTELLKDKERVAGETKIKIKFHNKKIKVKVEDNELSFTVYGVSEMETLAIYFNAIAREYRRMFK